MPIQLGAAPQADFDRPIDLMMDCHRRVEHFLEVLLRVARDVRGGVLNDEYRQALHIGLNYFLSGAPRHTEDEEHSLFPRMRQVDDPCVKAALAQIDALEADHVAARTAHDRVESLGRRWLADDHLRDVEAGELLDLLVELQQTYARHICIEDEQIFPLATQVLSPQKLHTVGREMAHRRRLDPGRAGSRCADRRRETLGPAMEPDNESR